jgi:hypothetical protein
VSLRAAGMASYNWGGGAVDLLRTCRPRERRFLEAHQCGPSLR